MKPINTFKPIPRPRPTTGGTTEIPAGYKGNPRPRANVIKQKWTSPFWMAFHVENVSTFRK